MNELWLIAITGFAASLFGALFGVFVISLIRPAPAVLMGNQNDIQPEEHLHHDNDISDTHGRSIGEVEPLDFDIVQMVEEIAESSHDGHVRRHVD